MSDAYNGDGSAPFVVGSDTSEAASISVNAGLLRLRVLRQVVDAGEHGVTCDEVELALGMKHQTASARIRELVLGSRVCDSTRRRFTRSHRKATVWVAMVAER